MLDKLYRTKRALEFQIQMEESLSNSSIEINRLRDQLASVEAHIQQWLQPSPAPKPLVVQVKETKILEDGTVLEGFFLDGELHGEGRIIFTNGKVYEGIFKHGALHGKGRVLFSEEGVLEGHFIHGQLVDFDRSDIGNTLFFLSLYGLAEGTAPTGASLGIIGIFLQQNETYRPYAEKLEMAYERLKIPPDQIPFESGKIHDELVHQKIDQLFEYGFHKHSMMLSLHVDEEAVICKLFNAGKGLEAHHPKPKKGKYQTMRQVKIPLKEFTPAIIELILKQNFENINAAYQAIFQIPGAQILDNGKNAVWQSPQKTGNCETEAIFAYLRNVMPDSLYKQMRYELFLESRKKAEQKLLQQHRDAIEAKLEKKGKRVW